MQGFNHISGGVAFTGIFASFTEINIFERSEYLAATALFSVFADIDHTKSLIGKAFYPISKWINRKFGHRTITHSLVFYLAFLIVLNGVEKIFYDKNTFTIIAAFAYSSHLIFDMCTKSGIPLFWPFTRRPAVLPANPNFRLSANDLRSEGIIFILFCSLVWFCQPLFANGFWTSYNKAFLTGQHVYREFVNSKDAIFLIYSDKEKRDSGIIVKASENEMIIFRDNFKKIDLRKTAFIDFYHTRQKIKEIQKSMFQVEAKEIERYLDKPILKLQIQSSNKINWFEGAILKTGNEIQIENVKGFKFFIEKENENQEIRKRIEILKAEISKKQNENQKKQNEVLEIESQVDEIVRNYDEKNDFEKTQDLKKEKILRQELKDKRAIEIETYQTELAEITELQKQLNKKVTISANMIILKIEGENRRHRAANRYANDSEL